MSAANVSLQEQHQKSGFNGGPDRPSNWLIGLMLALCAALVAYGIAITTGAI